MKSHFSRLTTDDHRMLITEYRLQNTDYLSALQQNAFVVVGATHAYKRLQITEYWKQNTTNH